MSRAHRQTDQLFAEFCRSGDPAALGAVFDRTAAELLHVAVWLCGNRADAEDLLQRTFVQAIELRAQFDPGRPVLPWLCGVLGNHARHLRRERARRLPESAPNGAHDPATAASDAEFAAAVRARVDAIAAPYREVLQLHLEQGLNAKQIGERLQRPAGTVRTQLVRALDLLRKQLPSGFVAGAAMLALPDASRLAALRAVVVAQAKAGATLATGGITTVAATAIVTGGLMTKNLFAAFAILLLLGIGVYSVWLSSPTVPPATVGAPTIVAAELGAAPSSTASTTAAIERTPVPDAEGSDPSFASVHVTVRWADDQSLAAGVGVHANGTFASNLRRSGLTDANGVALLEHLRPGAWWIVTSHGVNLPKFELRAGQHENFDLLAHRTGMAHGRVIDPDGNPVADASIWCGPDGASGVTYLAANSDAGGNFVLPVLHMHALCARKDGFDSSYLESLRVDNGRAPDVVLQLRARGGGLRGRVVDSRGAPIQWAKVQIGEVQIVTSTSHQFPIGEEIVTGADGVFVAHGMPAEPTKVQAWATGHGFWSRTICVAVGEQRELTIELADGATVHGTVRDDAGAIVAGASVTFGDRLRDFASARAFTDDAGRFTIEDVPGGECTLKASKAELQCTVTLPLSAGESTQWNPVLGKGRTIRGRVVDDNERAVAGVEIGFIEPHFMDPRSWSTAAVDGRFEVTNVGDQPVELVVRKNGIQLRRLHVVPPDSDNLLVKLSVGDAPSAFLRGRVLDHQHLPLAATIMAIPRTTRSSGITGRANDAASGEFVCGPLPADTYDVVVRAKGLGSIVLGAVRLAPRQDLALGDVPFQPAGTVRFTQLDVAGKTINTMLRVYDQRGNEVAQSMLESGKEPMLTLQPGRFTAIASLRSLDASVGFEVNSGEQHDVTLQAVAAATVTLRVPNAQPSGTVRVLALRTDGAPAFVGDVDAAFAAGSGTSLNLRPGAYRIHCQSDDGREAATELVIGSVDEHPSVTVELPPH